MNWVGSVSAALPISPCCEWKIENGMLWILRKGLFQHVKRWCRSTRFERTRSTSRCPSSAPRERFIRKSKPAFFLQLSRGAVVDQVLGFEATDLFVAGAQQPNNIADAVNGRVNFLFVKIDHALITFLGVLHPSEAQRFGQT